MRDLQEIKELLRDNSKVLSQILLVLTEGVDSSPTPEPEPEPEPEKTTEELEKALRIGLNAFQARGGVPKSLIFAVLGEELKTGQMTRDQIVAMLNNPEVQ